MQKIRLLLIVFHIQCMQINYLHGIRVHEDDNEEPTVPTIHLTTTPSPLHLNESHQSHQSHESHIDDSKELVHMHHEHSIHILNGPNVSEPLPLHLKNVTVPKGFLEKGSLHSRELAHDVPETTKIGNFVPSPEMAIDFSQSSESNEKPVFNKDHHYFISLQIPSNSSKSVNSASLTHTHGTFSHGYTQTVFGKKKPLIANNTPNGAIINANDKLPWPYPYEHTENEYKWRPIKPNSDVDGHGQFDGKLTVLPISDASSSTTYNPLVFPSDLDPIPTIINPTSPYHPYSYETVYVTKHTNLTADYGGSVNGFDAPNDIQSDDENHLLAKDGLIPAESLDKNVFWSSAVQVLAAALPVGLILSAMYPNVVYVDANATRPLSDMYPMPIPPAYRPPSYPAYMAPRPTKTAAFPYTLNKDEQVPAEKPDTDMAEFMDTSRRLRDSGQLVMAVLCENRHLCELGLAAVKEKDPNKSAHTIYKSLWRISNGQPNQKSVMEMDNIFRAIQLNDCSGFKCTIK